ncbi:MAG TPA: hypothetical protein VK174_03180 [Chitinophagales bacterium]|nr:hypothetical protein [Chitinophagales bacterium]
MKTSDSLFRLIKSLSKNEKGYFKKMAEALSGGTGSNYLLLFDAIDGQGDYDEPAIIKQFSKEKFTKNLSVTKRNLTDLILKALRLYQSSRNAKSEITALLENADIYFARQLHKDAFDCIDRARHLAKEIDLPLQVLEADNKARGFNMEMSGRDWGTNVEQYLLSLKDVSAQYRQSVEITELHYRLFHFWKHERLIRTEEQEKFIDAFMQSPLLQLDPVTCSFFPRQTLLTIRMIYCFLKNDTQQAFEWCQQVLNLWEAHPAIQKDQPIRYIAAYTNYFSNCLRIKRYDLIAQYLQKADTGFMAGNETAKAAWFVLVSNFTLIVLEEQGDADKLLEALPPILTGLKEHEQRLKQIDVVMLRYNALMVYFIAEKFGEALDIVNRLMDIKDLDLRTDIQAAVRIINLIVHYELGNQVLLDNAIKNTRRYLQSREKYFELEKIFFRHFSKLTLSADKIQRDEVYRAMNEELMQMVNENPLEKNFLQTFNFTCWLQARLQNISLQQYFKQSGGEVN